MEHGKRERISRRSAGKNAFGTVETRRPERQLSVRHALGIVGLVAAVATVVGLVGCSGSAKESPKEKEVVKRPAAKAPANPVKPGGDETSESPSDKDKKRPAPPPKPVIAKVMLDDKSAATCLVRIGERLPEGQLPDLKGKSHSILSLRGKKLSVVFFWTAENPYSLQGLQDLDLDVAQKYGDRGVAVIAINQKDKPEAVRKAVTEAEAKYPQLLDEKGEYFAKVAKERLPRVYLVDADGKILWFDLEYSTSTRRDLIQGIKAVLGDDN